MLASYQKHWLSYQQGAKFLHNLFSYFNRVSLKKYKMTEPDSSLEAILGGPTPAPPPLLIFPNPASLWFIFFFVILIVCLYCSSKRGVV